MAKYLNTGNNGITPIKVSIPCCDETLAGHLYLPENYDATKKYPAVVVGGALSTVKEQMGGTYAAELSKHGIIAAAIDYRGWGESTGAARQCEDENKKAEDMITTLRWLRENYSVSGTGILGVCTSSTNTLYAAADYPDDVKAIVTVAGTFYDISQQLFVKGRRKKAEVALKKYQESGQIDMVPVFGMHWRAFAPVNMDYYINPERGNIPQWKNELAVMSYLTLYKADCPSKAPQVKCPVLMLHPKKGFVLKKVQALYDSIPGEKDFVWFEGTNLELYDDPDHIYEASDRAAEFLKKHLS